MESLWNLSAGQFTGAALALGALLMEGLTPDQQAQLGNLLMLTGQMMVTYSAQILFLQSRWPPGTGGYPGTVGTAAPPAGGSGTVLCSPIPLRGRIWYTVLLREGPLIPLHHLAAGRGLQEVSSMADLSRDPRFAQYARLIVEGGCNLHPGQEVVLSAPVACGEFVHLAVRQCYQSGASDVVVLYQRSGR